MRFQLGFLLVGGATKPHIDGESQDAFDDSMTTSFEDNWGDAEFFHLSQEIHTLLPLFTVDAVLFPQIRSLEIVDPRNLNDSICLTTVLSIKSWHVGFLCFRNCNFNVSIIPSRHEHAPRNEYNEIIKLTRHNMYVLSCY